MERSDHFGMPGDEPDESQDRGYPRAPLPPHERRWRHPSEVGAHTWAQTEPPLVIGRWLMATSGVVGALLTAGVLWAMLPPDTRRDVATLTSVTLGNTSRTSAAATNTRPTATNVLSQDTLVRTTRTQPDIAALTTTPTTRQQPTRSTNFTSASVPQPSVALTLPLTDTPPLAVAIAGTDLDGSNLMITTASAAADDDRLWMTTTSGQPTEAHVVFVDEPLGIAIVRLDDPSMSTPFAVGDPLVDGDSVTVGLDEQVEATVEMGDADTMTLEMSSVRSSANEGSPVFDADGRLVGLVSHDDSGTAIVVAIPDVETLTTAAASTDASGETTTSTDTESPTGHAWLGVQLSADPLTPLTIVSVVVDGPVDAAGLIAGDTIVAFDGVAMTSAAALVDALAAANPGQTVSVQIERVNRTTLVVDVVLGNKPADL